MITPLLDSKKAAGILGCSVATVTRLCLAHKLRHCKVGNRYKFRECDLQEYLTSTTVMEEEVPEENFMK